MKGKKINGLKKNASSKIINIKIKESYHSLLSQIYITFLELIRKLLSQNMKIRKIYDFAILTAKTLKYEGLELLIHQIRTQNFEKHVKSSEIPIVESVHIRPDAFLPLTKTLQVKFSVPANNLNKVNIFTGSSQGANTKIKFQIIDEKHVVRESILKGCEIRDGGYISLKFKPIKESKNKMFCLKMEPMGQSSALILYENKEEIKELTVSYGNEHLNGKIGFQAFSDLGIQREYDLWTLRNNLTAAKKEQYKIDILDFAYKPKISIIMPVYNVDQIWLEKAIDSVRNQLYVNWELCIADDSSTKYHIKSTLDRYSKTDSRIKIKYLRENLGISGASNEALSLSTGEFIGLLDNDDELSADALYEVVKLLNKKSRADLIYSDEDKIDVEGRRSNPFFKPDWSPDTLLSVNYISHFSVIRKKIIDEVGKFRLGFEGSQDYDLFLRITENTNNIEHIPRILYHWRMIPGSTASNINAKDKAHINGIKALQDHLKRQKIDGMVSDSLNRTNYQVDYVIKGDPFVSIIIHFKDNMQYIKKCISSIARNTEGVRYEILLMVPNKKERPLFLNLDPMKKLCDINVLTYDPLLNTAAINNFASINAKGDYLLFLSSKIVVTTSNWLAYLLMNAQRKEIGCVGPKILTPDGRIQNAGIVLGINGEKCNVFSGLPDNYWTNFGMNTWSKNYLAISGECLMLNKSKFSQVGGFNKDLECHEDIDLCLRIHKEGYRNLCTAAMYVYYFGIFLSNETPSHDVLQEISRFDKPFSESRDPFYNPNLNLKENSCQLDILN